MSRIDLINDPEYLALRNSQKLEVVRSELAEIRRLLWYIRNDASLPYPAIDTDCVEGLITCGINYLHGTMEETMKIEIRRDDKTFGPSLPFSSRGTGTEWGIPCLVCGKDPEHGTNLSAYVDSKEDGETIVKWFNGLAKLDFRPSEPNYVQVKLGACDAHVDALKKINKLTGAHRRIREVDAKSILPLDEKTLDSES